MEALLNEMKSSLASVKPTCKLIPPTLPTVQIDVNRITESFERTKGLRAQARKTEVCREFEKEIDHIQKENQTRFDRIRHLSDTISNLRKNEEIDVSQIADDVYQVAMNVNGHPVSFHVQADTETNRFFGIQSKPAIDALKNLEVQRDLVEIIAMMSAAFKEHFSKS